MIWEHFLQNHLRRVKRTKRSAARACLHQSSSRSCHYQNKSLPIPTSLQSSQGHQTKQHPNRLSHWPTWRQKKPSWTKKMNGAHSLSSSQKVRARRTASLGSHRLLRTRCHTMRWSSSPPNPFNKLHFYPLRQQPLVQNRPSRLLMTKTNGDPSQLPSQRKTRKSLVSPRSPHQ